MRCGERVRVKPLANVDPWHRNRTGTVIADSAPGEAIQVEFDDEAIAHQFLAEDLEPIDD
jgi:hypothetical protein